LRSALLQRDGEFDESDTLVSDLVATLQVLLVHPTIDLSVLVGPVWWFYFICHIINLCSFNTTCRTTLSVEAGTILELT